MANFTSAELNILGNIAIILSSTETVELHSGDREPGTRLSNESHLLVIRALETIHTATDNAAISAVRADERERCAKDCDEVAAIYASLHPSDKIIADLIRAKIIVAEICAHTIRTPLRKHTPFICPDCGAASWNPNDKTHRYCGRCHKFFAKEAPMTILNCPRCGGTHFGSLTCPFDEPPEALQPKPTVQTAYAIDGNPTDGYTVTHRASQRRWTTCPCCDKRIGSMLVAEAIVTNLTLQAYDAHGLPPESAT
jgi:predicted RNA-binding Zn-ribbon protein involved in translation (DUF1610 family)